MSNAAARRTRIRRLRPRRGRPRRGLTDKAPPSHLLGVLMLYRDRVGWEPPKPGLVAKVLSKFFAAREAAPGPPLPNKTPP